MNNDYQFDPGQDQGSYQPVNMAPVKNGKKYGVASLVLGIIGVVCCTCCCCCYYVSVITGILAIVFACLSKRDDGGKMRGIAVAGLVLGIIAIVLFFAWVIGDLASDQMTEEELKSKIEQFYREKFGQDINLDDYMNQYLPNGK